MFESDWMLIRILSYKIARLERCKRQHSSLESPLPVMQTTKSSCEIFAPPLGSFFPFFFFSLKWAFHFPDCLPRQLIPLISPATGGCELSQMWEHLFCMAYTRTSSRETYSLGVFFFFFLLTPSYVYDALQALSTRLHSITAGLWITIGTYISSSFARAASALTADALSLTLKLLEDTSQFGKMSGGDLASSESCCFPLPEDFVLNGELSSQTSEILSRKLVPFGIREVWRLRKKEKKRYIKSLRWKCC